MPIRYAITMAITMRAGMWGLLSAYGRLPCWRTVNERLTRVEKGVYASYTLLKASPISAFRKMAERLAGNR